MGFYPAGSSASVFSERTLPQQSQTLEVDERVRGMGDFPLVGEEVVCECLGNIKVHKSMGPDGVHPRVLRELAEVVAEPLSVIYQRSWRTGEVPEDWRTTSVSPVFKKGKKEDPGNYRPVSLASVPGKPPLAGGLDSMISRGLFPSLQFCDSVVL